MGPASGRRISAQIQIWLRPVLITCTIRPAWRRTERISNSIPYSASLVRRCAFGQRKGQDVIPARGAKRAVATGADDEVLTVCGPRTVGHGRRLSAGRQPVLPQLAAGIDVEGTQETVGRGRD